MHVVQVTLYPALTPRVFMFFFTEMAVGLNLGMELQYDSSTLKISAGSAFVCSTLKMSVVP